MGLPRLRQRRDPLPDSAAVDQDLVDPDSARPVERRRRGLRRRQPPEARIAWQNGDALATRVLHIALVAALVSGPVALTWVWLTKPAASSGPVTGAGESTAPQTHEASLAAATAQRLVLTWLTASVSDKAAVQALLVDQLPATVELPEKRSPAPGQMWVGEVDQRAPGRYRVVVATVGGAPGGTAYFAVPVRVEGGVAAALSLPARTRPPAPVDPEVFQQPALSAVATDDPAFQTAAGYVTAYLTGSAELDRWTAPGADLTPVTPAACRTVRIDNVATVVSDSESPAPRIAVITTANCQAVGRPSSTGQYGLVLQVRDGRWEVVAEDPALLLDPVATTEAPPSTPSSPANPSPSITR